MLYDDKDQVLVVRESLKSRHPEKMLIAGANVHGFIMAGWTPIANLGENPKVGSVYGFRVEPHLNTEQHKGHKIHFFTEVSQAAIQRLQRSLDIWAPLMKTLGVSPEVSVRAQKGLRLGGWSMRKGKAVLHIYPNAIETGDDDMINETIPHELGHFIWDKKFGEKLRAKWVQMYHDQTIVIDTIELKLMVKLAQQFEASGLSAGKFVGRFKNLKTSDKAKRIRATELANTFKRMLKWAKGFHNLSLRHLQHLINTKQPVAKYFPTQDMLLAGRQVTVTPYACKNATEYWCESFALYMNKKALPDDVSELMKRTLKVLKLEK